MSGLKRIRIGLFVMSLLACVSALAFAQEFRGSIAGRVTESSGSAVANAQVVVTNISTNNSVSSVTDGMANSNFYI